MTLIWDGSVDSGDLSRWGGIEYGGTFDGTPPLKDQAEVVTEDNGVLPCIGSHFIKLSVAPGDQYGSSTGWRVLMRPTEPIKPMANGYDSTFTYAIAVPYDYPPNSADPNSRMWVAGMEIHHSNGVNGAPGHFIVDKDVMNVGMAGGDLNARTVSLDKNFNQGYAKKTWYVITQRTKHDPVNGAIEVYVGQKGKDSAPLLIAKLDNIPTAYAPYNGAALYNYVLFGLYTAQVGTLPTVMYMDGNKEFSTLAEGLDWASKLLGSDVVTPPVTPLPAPISAVSSIVDGATVIGPTDWVVTIVGQAAAVEFYLNGKSVGIVPIVNGKATTKLDANVQTNVTNGGFHVYAADKSTLLYRSPSIAFTLVRGINAAQALLEAKRGLTHLRLSTPYKTLSKQSGWTSTEIYKSEQHQLLVIKALGG